ncbi:glycosyltransferase [Agrococcus sediminis]|uniref:4,4'-diaponeurosporenoate glycosyltransferase n=1 Tax=Agrococcus sediminis TaxID=2599924 RepID=A0A5M8QJX6_9MICO|nr:glycosyltransferase [Agrococcus sediminis]KAA6436339.1 glycosyltransferase [Agrococcus sediminis]
MSAPRIRRLLVVVPARDEAGTVAACVASVHAAAAALAEARPEIEVRLVVVADACADATAAVARAAGAEVLEIDAAAVGVARQRGVEHGLGADPADGRSWIATTDADSVVPRSWLLDHADAAESGADLLVGRVEPDAAHLPPGALAAWRAAHDHLPVGASVHGANLGVRADALARVGGFAPVRLHEDVDLVARLRGAGAVADAVERAAVVTSGRTRSRVRGGFASYLAALSDCA